MDTPELLLVDAPMFDTACVGTGGTRMKDVRHISPSMSQRNPTTFPLHTNEVNPATGYMLASGQRSTERHVPIADREPGQARTGAFAIGQAAARMP